MSEENVEVARQATDAFDRRDWAVWIALHDENVEAIPIRDWPEPEVRGSEAYWDFLVKMVDAWDPVPFGEAEYTDAGVDKVLIHQRTEFRRRQSGAEVDFEYWIVATIRQGKSRRAEWFVDRAEALEAAGLSE